ncbi:putative late blight resistance protein R1A-3 isoform X1 [Salvia divinorum]|uniref:Late blight resistance protein R1A-3 isoform X1 n=1 Tax=Salvia divinorum TaxID=28513 RepID=A0ABD1G1P5_SALDI
MAAYASLNSLMKVIDDIETHPSPPIFLDKQQVESLTEKLVFLQEFLESYDSPYAYSDEADPLEMRIVDAAHVAEDVIESYIIDTMLLSAAATDDGGSEDDNYDDGGSDGDNYDDGGSDDDNYDDGGSDGDNYDDGGSDDDNYDDGGSDDDNYDDGGSEDDNYDGDGDGEEISCIHFYQDLHNVIEEIDWLKKEVAGITREKVVHQRIVAGFRSSSTEKKPIMVGFDGVLLQLLDRLTDGNTNLQIIPIVGMGGIGKTTLAKGAFEHRLIKDHFDICVWTTISQDYNIVETLRQVLSRAGGSSISMDEKELEVELHKRLWGRRYLVILDDVWSIDVWDRLKFSFPDCGDGSRVAVTTRMSNLAAHLTDSYSIFKMGFLDEASSWTLFSNTVLGEQSFPTRLEKIGRKIVGKCNGLPLAIAVIGGLMAKSELTLGYWVHIEENLSSIVNSENDDYCLRILKLSYNHLPAYLKPCFLYMGVFEEDSEIRASRIVELWVSEGFLKPIDNKSFTEIARECLKELVDRNLILVHKSGILGNIKSCKIHDLLRDLSMKEAQMQRFFYVLREQSPQGVISQHRIVIPTSTSKEKFIPPSTSKEKFCDALGSMSHARSYVSHKGGVPKLTNSRFLRTLYAYASSYSFENVNSRCIAFTTTWEFVIPSINLLWNLHTLIIDCVKSFTAPIEIWKTHKLRHVDFLFRNLRLPDPPSIDNDIIIMKNLEVLKGVRDFSLSEDVVKRIPHIKKLKLTTMYRAELLGRVNCLGYLHCLTKLESLNLIVYPFDDTKCLLKMSFPPSLKKVYLSPPIYFEWEEILQPLGSLPLLQKLTLYCGRFRTSKWETIEDQFPSLKSLTLDCCDDLENWTVLDSSHFPLLQELHLRRIYGLKEIPSEIGGIATLRSIELINCSESVLLSAKQILKEQEDIYGDQLDLKITARVLGRTIKNW